jgi:type I restriction enzyme M protein
MLDSETKRRIDSCRDILVGKVPDPKSQVEQITIALIYKFMDDMDAEAEELGGKRSFFAGDYARFGWAKLMAPNLGGFEVLALYSEAISTMPKNPGVPELFRDIFKNAYLPYRDPETLKNFLKEINVFTYDHSEKLGDAFEYLLSVLGSQGDAGQFRTPRHIIDFMVAVMDPKKNESVLDPACGTAGFLISAWKHILKNNSKLSNEYEGNGPIESTNVSGNLLLPDERTRLAANIRGYDISPDMVRLSLVNLYLHGFSDPHIVEYDTLTQDDKWNEVADVILANPPFMSPKGGIKPHKRFSVQATRSEVLFVDYMAEHLTATGRAAIVVPEGIIFQSGTAYKALRKMLVDSSLVAVVSLPAGVFNPYSGVKTSILMLDKRVHKQTDKVLFVKVGNDGFNLGAQRRAVVNSDLPEATRLLRSWMVSPDKFEGDGVMAQAVARARIGESGDFNLSGERYLVSDRAISSFSSATIDSLCDLVRGSSPRPQGDPKYFGGPVPRLMVADITRDGMRVTPRIDTLTEEGSKKSRPMLAGSVVMAVSGNPGLPAILQVDACIHDGFVGFRDLDSTRLLPEFLYYVLLANKESNKAQSVGAVFMNLTTDQIRAFLIPLPPLEIQHQIVAEIEGYQKIIEGARQVLDNYKSHIVVSPDWPVVPLGTLVSTSSGGTPSKSEPELWTGTIPWVSPKDMKVDLLVDTEDHISDLAVSQSATKLVGVNTLLGVVRSGILQHTFPVALTTRPMCFNQDIVAIQSTSPELDIRYLFYIFKSNNAAILKDGIKPGVTVQSFHSGYFKSYPLPLPDLETQHAIVADIEAEQALVAANRELIRRMEAKVKAAIDRVWGGA